MLMLLHSGDAIAVRDATCNHRCSQGVRGWTCWQKCEMRGRRGHERRQTGSCWEVQAGLSPGGSTCWKGAEAEMGLACDAMGKRQEPSEADDVREAL